VDDWARGFDDWVMDRVSEKDVEALAYRSRAPHADQAVPTSEHFDPLFVVLGAAPGARVRTVYEGIHYGNLRCAPSRLGLRFLPAAVQVDLTGRTCLVTGANSGIGRRRRALARMGGHVILACRNAERGAAARRAIVEDTGNASVELRLVDLASQRSIRDLAAGVLGIIPGCMCS
jgi:hypothetical protein